MEETKHWEALKAGDMKSLQSLYDLHIQGLYAYGMMLCQDGEKVKDCIHELFLALWNNHQNVTVPRSGKAYLLVSLRRRIFDPGPKSNLRTEQIEDIEIDRITSTSDHETGWIEAQDDQERMEKLEQAMGRITPRQREIIHMKYYQQMEYDDIAQLMNLNYQSARNLVTRALMALRREMVLILLILVGGM
jgi:RNA polymerase sigma factor (sigma-70 family)